MPEMSGLEAAQALAEDWPDDGTPFPLIVFVTAYDQYALQAFERAAFDYVLKPVEPARLAQTCAAAQRAGGALTERRGQRRARRPARGSPSIGLAAAVEQLRHAALATSGVATAPVEPLRVIQAGDRQRRSTWCRSTRSSTSRRPTSTSVS